MSAHYLQMSHMMKQYRFVLSCLEFVMTFMYVKKTFTGLYTKWDSFTPCKYKINLIRTLTYHCYQIFSSCSLLQSALDDLRKLLLQNGYPQGIINCHVNDVLGTKPKQMRCPVRMVPKKDFIILLRYLGRQSNQISECQKSFIYQCYSWINLKIVFQNICSIKSFFPYKNRLDCSQRSKVINKAYCWNCWLEFTLVKLSDGSLIGKLNISSP